MILTGNKEYYKGINAIQYEGKDSNQKDIPAHFGLRHRACNFLAITFQMTPALNTTAF